MIQAEKAVRSTFHPHGRTIFLRNLFPNDTPLYNLFVDILDDRAHRTRDRKAPLAVKKWN